MIFNYIRKNNGRYLRLIKIASKMSPHTLMPLDGELFSNEGILLDRHTLLNIILYVDDLTLITKTKDEFQRTVYRLSEICQEYARNEHINKGDKNNGLQR